VELKLTVARDVGACPDCVLGTQSETGSLQLVAALTADAARGVDLAAALTLHEVRVFRQSHWRTRLDCSTFTTTNHPHHHRHHHHHHTHHHQSHHYPYVIIINVRRLAVTQRVGASNLRSGV